MENIKIDFGALNGNKNGAVAAIVLVVSTALVALGKKAIDALN